MTEVSELPPCERHSERLASLKCSKCSTLHCVECFFDPILVQCDYCLDEFLDTVELPSKSLSSDAYFVVAGIFFLVFLLMIVKQSERDQDLIMIIISATIKAAVVSGVAYQAARTYGGVKYKGDGRTEFETEYRSLIERLKRCLGDTEEIDLNSLFNRDFSALELEDKLSAIRDFCFEMERTDNTADA